VRFVSQSRPLYLHCAHHFPGAGGAIGRVHGHTFVVVARVASAGLDGYGRGVDLVALNDAMGAVAFRLDHRDLNELTGAPSMEWIASQVAHEIERRGWELVSVTVEEPGIGVVELEDRP